MNKKDYWTIQYRNIAGSPRETKVYEDSLMDALHIFNTQKETSGFDTPIRMTASYGVNGRRYIFTLDGRYGVPRRV
jgi:hypothetical protein